MLLINKFIHSAAVILPTAIVGIWWCSDKSSGMSPVHLSSHPVYLHSQQESLSLGITSTNYFHPDSFYNKKKKKKKMNRLLILLMSVVTIASGADVTLLLTIDASLTDMLSKNNAVATYLSTALGGGTVTCNQICDKATLQCQKCDVTGTFSTVKKTHIATYYGSTDITDLTATAASMTAPLEVIFGTGNVQPTAINQLETNSPSPSSAERVVSVTYEVTIEFVTLRDNHLQLTTKTQEILEGTGTAVCDKICEMKPLDMARTTFELTPRCYECDGRFKDRDVATLAAERWQITITGVASPTKQNFAIELNSSLRVFFVSISGILHRVEATVIVEAGPSDSDDSISGNTVAAIVVGCIGFIIILILAIYCTCCKQPAEPESNEELQQTKDAPDTPDTA